MKILLTQQNYTYFKATPKRRIVFKTEKKTHTRLKHIHICYAASITHERLYETSVITVQL